MRMKAVKCTNCGAKLQPAPAAMQVTCEYCGTTSRVQTRGGPTRDPSPGQLGLPVAQPWGRQMVWLYAAPIGVMVVAGIIYGIFQAAAPAPGASTATPTTHGQSAQAVQMEEAALDLPPPADAAPPPPPPHDYVVPEWPVFIDMNGDEIDDLVVFLRAREGTSVRLAALDGATGDLLWQSERLASKRTQELVVGVTREVVIAAGPALELRSFDLATGTRGWSARLPERPWYLCQVSDDFVEVALADQKLVRVSAADGQVTERGRAPRNASRCPTGRVIGSPPSDSRRERPTAGSRRLGAMTVWHEAHRRGTHVALGGKHPGTPVPMVARYRQPRAVIWQRPFSSVESFDLGPITFGYHIAADDEVVVALVNDTSLSTEQTRAAAFALADGTPRWEVTVPQGGYRVELVTLQNGAAYIFSPYAVRVLDLADGSLRWAYGSGFDG
jgi:DNA-directed RNA polymerase subunit RPC12/RpoP